MKRIGLMQPYMFPYVGYFQLMQAVDEYVFYDDVQFIKGGWINRNNILINGQKSLLTVALSGASANKQINEIEVQDDFVKFRKTLQMAYAKAPYKDDVVALIDDIVSFDDKNLARFIGNSLRKIISYIGISVATVYSSELNENKDLRGQDRVIAICKELKGDGYVNAIGGQELYDREAFAAQQLELRFLRSNAKPYRQLNKEFVPSLSIIDVMMFNSPEQVFKMMDSYELI